MNEKQDTRLMQRQTETAQPAGARGLQSTSKQYSNFSLIRMFGGGGGWRQTGVVKQMLVLKDKNI
jgi:hypothetical protein